jgi:hypothetical protein
MEKLDKNEINVGFIIQIYEEDWRELESIIKNKVKRLIFVKRCPVTVKLEIKEIFPSKGGENNGYNGETVTNS